ncbi:hypothetical protein [uncultured Sphingomonas sp.]|uniref:hypothetical protein n=1 Tax=uncultured Sphingomonas sp. TaxID=158754 RepID=UPI0025F2F624|nr:hypothetical protein [uncultured Sphingomonas sp.]
MKKFAATALLVAMSASLAACSGKGDDKLATQAEERAEAKADEVRAMGGNEATAERIEKDGERRADAIDDSDVNADKLTEGQKNAMTAPQ